MTGTCPRTPEVDRHFARQLAPAEEHALREHLPTCEACTARYERHLRLAEVLPGVSSAEERLAQGLGFAGTRPSRAPTRAAAVVGVLVAAAVAALFLRMPPGPGALDPTPRGGQAQVVALEVYTLAPGRPAARDPAVCGPDDELAFAYRNAAGKKYLLIFGVDATGAVHWYHPAWTDPAADPTAIAIEASDQVHELKEAIGHGAPVGPLELEAWFTDRPLTVKQVEAARSAGAMPEGILRVRRHLEVRR